MQIMDVLVASNPANLELEMDEEDCAALAYDIVSQQHVPTAIDLERSNL